MELIINIPDKYEKRLKDAAELDPSVRQRMITELETQAMQQIQSLYTQAQHQDGEPQAKLGK